MMLVGEIFGLPIPAQEPVFATFAIHIALRTLPPSPVRSPRPRLNDPDATRARSAC